MHIFVIGACNTLTLTKMNDSTIKDNLARMRQELGYTKTRMADELHMSLNGYVMLENGKTRMLSEHIYDFADVAKVSVAELVNGFEPVSSVESGLDDVKTSYDKKFRSMEDSYVKEIMVLQAQVERLKDKVHTLNEIVRSNRKLIERYEKELQK